MREYSCDLTNVQELCHYLECKALVISALRIGCFDKSANKLRLLKVQLQSTTDKSLLLRAAKFLRDDPSTLFIYMIPWFPPVELTKLRDTQNRYRQLNNESSILKDDRKPFVVVSGRLMERTAKGFLRPVRNNTDATVIPNSSSSLSSVASSHAVSSIAALPRVAVTKTTSFSTSSSVPLSSVNSSSAPLGGANTTSAASNGITSSTQPKNLNIWEPCGSLGAIFYAASSSKLLPATIILRNLALTAQLDAKQLESINIFGDGNCFFRALSLGLYSDQSAHIQLRSSIAQHLVKYGSIVFASVGFASSDLASITKAAASIRQPNTWAGEDIVLVVADFLQRDIYVYIDCESISPLVYSPTFYRPTGPQILLAFYEPGHYCGLFQSLPAISNGQAEVVNLAVKITELSCQLNDNSEAASVKKCQNEPLRHSVRLLSFNARSIMNKWSYIQADSCLKP